MVIGLGQFGLAVVRELSERGSDVLAVDVSEERVQVASRWATSALCFDSTDEVALAQAAPERRDVVICAIGDDTRDAAIITTALLRQMGCRRVVARASSDILERILTVVGAHEVVNPERSFGERYAGRLLFEYIREEIPLGEDFFVSEMTPPPSYVGRTLAELKLPNRYSVTVLGVKRCQDDKQVVQVPRADVPLEEDDILIIAASRQALRDFTSSF
jgi:trk system potassium uptake protein TrkA